MTDEPRERRKPTLRERAEASGLKVREADPNVVHVMFLGPKGAEAMKKRLEGEENEKPRDAD
jgi:hypothetical protein